MNESDNNKNNSSRWQKKVLWRKKNRKNEGKYTAEKHGVKSLHIYATKVKTHLMLCPSIGATKHKIAVKSDGLTCIDCSYYRKRPVCVLLGRTSRDDNDIDAADDDDEVWLSFFFLLLFVLLFWCCCCCYLFFVSFRWLRLLCHLVNYCCYTCCCSVFTDRLLLSEFPFASSFVSRIKRKYIFFCMFPIYFFESILFVVIAIIIIIIINFIIVDLLFTMFRYWFRFWLSVNLLLFDCCRVCFYVHTFISLIVRVVRENTYRWKYAHWNAIYRKLFHEFSRIQFIYTQQSSIDNLKFENIEHPWNQHKNTN